jgi:hypothetical protein
VIFADKPNPSLQQRVILESRNKYAKPVAEIRADINNRTHTMFE